MSRSKDDEKFMRLAIEQANLAEAIGEVPIGAVVVRDGKVIASAHNLRETTQDPTAHAELLAAKQAAEVTGFWRLVDCTMYVTLEPCPMCAGTMVNARVDRLVFGARDPKAGAVRSLYAITEDPRLNHHIDVREGVLADECGSLLSAFFKRIREKK